MRHGCDMIDFTCVMHQAYRGLYSFALACKLSGALKGWPNPETEALVYENRFKFLKESYRYVNYSYFQGQN